MAFERFEKVSESELEASAAECFRKYGTAGGLDKPAYLLEAQIYVRELERRHDAKIAWRDLFLELIVILLIGGEIALGIWGIVIAQREGKDQAELLGKQKTILEHLETSTAATAATLVSVQSTMELMKKAAQGRSHSSMTFQSLLRMTIRTIGLSLAMRDILTSRYGGASFTLIHPW